VVRKQSNTQGKFLTFASHHLTVARKRNAFMFFGVSGAISRLPRYSVLSQDMVHHLLVIGLPYQRRLCKHGRKEVLCRRTSIDSEQTGA
jgi:hypothetical protein